MTASFAKPVAIPVWDQNLTNATVPTAPYIADGWAVGVPPSSAFDNYQDNLIGTWIEWLDERFADGATKDELIIKSPDGGYNTIRIADGEVEVDHSGLSPVALAPSGFKVTGRDDSGALGGKGGEFIGGGPNGVGVSGAGQGTGAGVEGDGGSSGTGGEFTGGLYGVLGQLTSSGTYAILGSAAGASSNGTGVYGISKGNGNGVYGDSNGSGPGVRGDSGSGNAGYFEGSSSGTAVLAYNTSTGDGLEACGGGATPIGSGVGYGAILQGASGIAPLWLVPLASAPTAQNEGEMYYNSSNNTAYYWNGSIWSPF